MNLRYTAQATDDLQAIWTYIASQRGIETADRVERRILDVCERLASGDFDGPETALGDDVVHSWPVRPYRVFYVRDLENLVVLRVYDMHRQPI